MMVGGVFCLQRVSAFANAINSHVAKRQRQAEKLRIVEEMKQADFPFKTWQEMEKDYEETFFG